MNLNFDFREFQKESMEKLQQIYAEALYDQEISEDCRSTYEKMQKILKCKEMEKCHPYLFTLDRQCLNEEEIQKVDELYECGVKRGFIMEDAVDDDEVVGDEYYDEPLCGGPSDSLTDQQMCPCEPPQSDTSCVFTVLYSAMKNGDVKVGEFYSSTYDEKSAKEDCISHLTETGYNNIQVMAVEQLKGEVDVVVVDDGNDTTNLLENLFEDDSEEYENQETGNIPDDGDDTMKDGENDTTDASGDIQDDKGTQDTADTTDDTEDDSEGDSEDTSVENTENDVEQDAEEDLEVDDSEKDDTKDSSVEDTEEDDTEDISTDEGGDEKELSSAEKTALKDEYRRLFNDTLKKTGLGKSVLEMTLSERIDFLKEMSEKWSKVDPSEFLSDKDEESMNKYIPEEEEEK